MANVSESRRVRPPGLQQEFDVRNIIQEAQVRWLKPPEICEILQNYEAHNFQLNAAAPVKPPSGSLFLFDRKALRHYRKDGHNWRKKSDGKTVREAHERLKVGSVEVLHCYYAHGDDNANFQRRSYWMLEGAYENIVLVHYLEIKQVKSKLSHLANSCTTGKVFPSGNNEELPYLDFDRLSALSLPPERNSSPGASEVQFVDSSLSSKLTNVSTSCNLEDVKGANSRKKIANLQFTKVGSALQDLSQSENFQEGTGMMVPCAVSKIVTPDWSASLPSLKHDFREEKMSTAHSRTTSSLLPHQVPPVQSAHSSLLVKQDSGISQPVTDRALQGLDSMEIPALLQDQGLPSWNEFIHSLEENDLAGSNEEEVQDFWKQEADSSIWEELYTICNNRASTDNQTGADTCDDVARAVSQSSFPMMAPVEAPFFSKEPDYLFRNGFSQQPPDPSGNPFRTSEENAFQVEAWTNDRKVTENHNAGVAYGEITSTEASKTSQQVGTPEKIPNSNLSRLINPSQHIKEGQALAVSSPYNAGNLKYMGSPGAPSAVQPVHKIQNQATQPPQEVFWQLEECQTESQELQSVGQDSVPQSVPMSSLLTQDVNKAEIIVPNSNPTPFIPQEFSDFNKTKADAVADSYRLENLKHPKIPQQVSEITLGIHSDVQMDIGSNPSLNHATKFSILDFSPNWGFSYEETKVLISGIFLKTEDPVQCQWSCVFDDIEVPAEVTNVGVISCKAPSHSPGSIPFFICSGGKRACSEIRQFEYRTERVGFSSQDGTTSPKEGGNTSPKEEELLWQIKLARMLLSDFEDASNDWDSMEQSVSLSSSINLKEKIFQIVMKEKLRDWLLAKVNEGAKAVSILNSSGQGLLHMVAALGYEWAIPPILAAGVGANFRDTRGWSALHWAAAHGREKAVLALLAAGAAAGPLTDPTPEFINGKTPADLAANNGHRGLAGFLAEMSLTTHFKSLTIIENNDKEFFSVSADWEGENAVEALSDKIRRQKSGDGVDDQLSLEQSLRAVRNAAQTAAFIRAAFRKDSFRKREVAEAGVFDEFGISPLHLKKIQQAHKLQKAFQTHWKKRHTAATRIQSRFRGWRRRKDFLDLRFQVTKIQAHVRGYQARKEHRKLLWAVGVLEKSVLRWRRKRIGIRDIHVRSLDAMEEDTDAIDDDDTFFDEGRRQKELIVGKAVKRVQSMVESTEARAQYSRLLEGSQQHNVDFQVDASCLQKLDYSD